MENFQYLTYDDYKALGGTFDVPIFEVGNKYAQKKLDHWTNNRICNEKVYEQYQEDIMLCMKKIVDVICERESGEQAVASFSNDGVSVTYAEREKYYDRLVEVYKDTVEILPLELVSWRI